MTSVKRKQSIERDPEITQTLKLLNRDFKITKMKKLKSIIQQRDWGYGLMSKRTCWTSMRVWVQIPSTYINSRKWLPVSVTPALGVETGESKNFRQPRPAKIVSFQCETLSQGSKVKSNRGRYSRSPLTLYVNMSAHTCTLMCTYHTQHTAHMCWIALVSTWVKRASTG